MESVCRNAFISRFKENKMHSKEDSCVVGFSIDCYIAPATDRVGAYFPRENPALDRRHTRTASLFPSLSRKQNKTNKKSFQREATGKKL